MGTRNETGAFHYRLCPCRVGLLPVGTACAQVLPYQVGSDDRPSTPAGGSGRSGSGGGPAVRTTIRPYLEVTQNLLAQITPGNDVVTYTTLAAGWMPPGRATHPGPGRRAL
jgi:hypothetical protein